MTGIILRKTSQGWFNCSPTRIINGRSSNKDSISSDMISSMDTNRIIGFWLDIMVQMYAWQKLNNNWLWIVFCKICVFMSLCYPFLSFRPNMLIFFYTMFLTTIYKSSSNLVNIAFMIVPELCSLYMYWKMSNWCFCALSWPSILTFLNNDFDHNTQVKPLNQLKYHNFCGFHAQSVHDA